MTNTIKEINFVEEMEQSFIDYSMTTITARALPDVRDGLKPVHRRILYGMRKLGITQDKPHKKSARIVGDVMGKYHPHGDSSIYEAMVRLSQDFSLKMPLVDGHGNFGSIDGDSAAAMRYTEARLDATSDYLLNDLDKDIVDMVPNYDETEIEPVVLPAMFPNLLVNGATGIASGMTTEIPTHNPKEVLDATIRFLENEKVSLDDLLKLIKGPDFPCGGEICNTTEVKEFYRSGIAKCIVRGEFELEKGTNGKMNIVFSTIPVTFVGQKNNLVNRLIGQVNDRTFEEVSDVRDESSREGVRLVVEVKKDVDVQKFINKLWVKSPMQDTITFRFTTIVEGEPRTIGLIDYLREFSKFQQELMTRKHNYLLKKYKERLEILSGLIRAHEVIDVIIDVIKNGKNEKEILKCMTKGITDGINFSMVKNKKIASKFDFTPAQAQAILEMKLKRLIALETKKLIKEYKQLEKDFEFSTEVVSDKKFRTKIIIEQLTVLRDSHLESRLTKMSEKNTDKIEEQVMIEGTRVSVDRFGYIKRLPENGEDEASVQTFDVTTADRLGVFASDGNFYQIKVNTIPVVKKKERGIPVAVLCKMKSGVTQLYVENMKSILKSQIYFISSKGLGKKIDGAELESTRGKILASKLKDDDTLLTAFPMTIEKQIYFETNLDRGGKFDLKEIPDLKRNAAGNRLLNLKEGEKLTKCQLIFEKEAKYGDVPLIGKNRAPKKL